MGSFSSSKTRILFLRGEWRTLTPTRVSRNGTQEYDNIRCERYFFFYSMSLFGYTDNGLARARAVRKAKGRGPTMTPL